MKKNVTALLAILVLIGISQAHAQDQATVPPTKGLVVSSEMHDGGQWQRVRLFGEGAKNMCVSLNMDISMASAGTIFSNDSSSCLMSAQGPIFGFIAGPNGEMVNLEFFGEN